MPTPLLVRVVVWLWLLIAVYAGNARSLDGQPAWVFGAVIVAPIVVIVLGYEMLRTVREWLDALDLRALVFLHATRFLAVFFLVLHNRGELPREFALPAAWGEMIIAGAAIVLSVLPLSPPARRRAVGIWNIMGLVGAIFGLITATRVAFDGAPQMAVFTELPFSLLPTFVTPLVLASHVILYRRLQREEASSTGE